MLRLFKNLKRQGNIWLAFVYLWRYLIQNAPRAVQRRCDMERVRGSGWKSGAVRLAVCVRGGVGDHIIAARFMRDLRSATEPFEFDVFSASPGAAKWIFSVLPGFCDCAYDVTFESVSSRYDVSLEISSVVTVVAQSTNPASQALKRNVESIRAFGREMDAFTNNSVRMDGFLAQKLQFRNATRATSPHMISGINYTGDSFPLAVDPACLASFALERQTYITVHNGFDAQCTISGNRATKCYPHFGVAVALLKQQFPAIKFVQIGALNSIPISQVDRDLIGKTSLPEAGAIIQGALAHLDNESGMVHMASCFSVPGCIVFGPTPADYFGYSHNVNLRPKICGNCWWITDDWMERCPRGFAEPVCTFTQTPQDVAQAMGRLLKRCGLVLKADRAAS